MINYDSESRLRAIAMNAVREAMLVYGRFDKPFTDDDAARADNIFNLLHLTERQEWEHANLVDEKQPAVSASVRKISDILADLSFDEEPKNPIPEAIAVKASLPKGAGTTTPAIVPAAKAANE